MFMNKDLVPGSNRWWWRKPKKVSSIHSEDNSSIDGADDNASMLSLCSYIGDSSFIPSPCASHINPSIKVHIARSENSTSSDVDTNASMQYYSSRPITLSDVYTDSILEETHEETIPYYSLTKRRGSLADYFSQKKLKAGFGRLVGRTQDTIPTKDRRRSN
ncbi:hypothetical protein BDB01DRAFT_768972 [Pilobolus umbonatus]|nr:hypothetical protein BDB01DRAFT_768972 [Pilobolus umbonatus]